MSSSTVSFGLVSTVMLERSQSFTVPMSLNFGSSGTSVASRAWISGSSALSWEAVAVSDALASVASAAAAVVASGVLFDEPHAASAITLTATAAVRISLFFFIIFSSVLDFIT